MQIRLLSQSSSLCFCLRSSSWIGWAAGGHARVMHRLLGNTGGQGFMEGVRCLVTLLATECGGTAGNVSDALWFWRTGGRDLR